MDHNFTNKIKAWLDTPEHERDLAAGALMVLQLSNNQIMYRGFIRNLSRSAKMIAYQLQKYYNFRVQNLTHEQVTAMQTQVATIVEKNHLDRSVKTKKEKAAAAEEFKKGKRADHDSLPDEVQAYYAENLSLLQKMRALHAKLSVLSTENATCPDSERYPFLKELIALDKRYHDNWRAYDTYGKE